MVWTQIEDLQGDWKKLANDELPPLVTVWQEQAEKLRESGDFKLFIQKLRREIAIETGVIEQLYTIERGITQLLIEQGINESLIPHDATDRPVKKVVALIRDQEAAVASLFDFVGRHRILSTSYIKELHQLLTQNQDSTDALVQGTNEIIQVLLVKGDWKRLPNNPMRDDGSIHEYCPPEHVPSEMDNLIEWHKKHLETGVTPEIEAAWLHHRFTQIHPFQDGNGRVARCLANLVFIQQEWFPLVITRDDRVVYIDALEMADKGDLSALVGLFAKAQKQAFIRSLSLSEQVLSETKRTKTIIASIADRLKQDKSVLLKTRIETVEKFANDLFERAARRMDEVANEIEVSIKNFVDNYEVFSVRSPRGHDKNHYHRFQVIETATQLRYFANLRNYHSWIQLVINVKASAIILLSFHALGPEYRGILVCSATAYHRDETEDGERNISDIHALSDSPFQFSYADDPGNLTERFDDWLENVVMTGLEYWNKSL